MPNNSRMGKENTTQVFSHKEGTSVVGRKIGGIEDNHIKRIKPPSERQMPCFLLLWLFDSIEIHKTVGVYRTGK